MHRSPAVANQFYPGDPTTLQATLAELIPSKTADEKQPALAVISPHAGYIYSGSTAGETLGAVVVPEDVLIMGPNHHGTGAAVALMDKGDWDMPMGAVPVNTTLTALLLKHSGIIVADTMAHRSEHSLEVQVPFLQYLQSKLTIAPIVVSHLPFHLLQELGRSIATAIKEYDRPVLMVASSDMTHYESREVAARKDRLALDRILAMDPEGLYNTVSQHQITMCGIMPATVALVAAKELGGTRAELIRYTDSGEASGDTRQVVGYAGMLIM
jgi:AmmeMemoRadiSam system protein B